MVRGRATMPILNTLFILYLLSCERSSGVAARPGSPGAGRKRLEFQIDMFRMSVRQERATAPGSVLSWRPAGEDACAPRDGRWGRAALPEISAFLSNECLVNARGFQFDQFV